MYFASGTSIRSFPDEGRVLIRILKDQGNEILKGHNNENRDEIVSKHKKDAKICSIFSDWKKKLENSTTFLSFKISLIMAKNFSSMKQKLNCDTWWQDAILVAENAIFII